MAIDESKTTLIYIIGGLSGINIKGTSLYEGLRNVLKSPNTEVIQHHYRQSEWMPKLPFPKRSDKSTCKKEFIPLLTDQTAEDLANQLEESIERKWAERKRKGPLEIIIIAHSSGSALLRRAMMLSKEKAWEQAKLIAVQESKDEKLKACLRPGDISTHGFWSDDVKKIIHIGGMTLGWQFNSQMPKQYLWLGPIIRPFFPYWFPWQLYRGSKFITETRISLNRKRLEDNIERYYILGTEDEFLSPGDAIEPGSLDEDHASSAPIYLEIEGFSHISILKSQELELLIKNIIHTNAKENSWKIKHPSTLKNICKRIPQQDIDDYLDPMDNIPARRIKEVEHVIIILHGIRDNGFWAKRIAHRIKEKWRTKKSCQDDPMSVRAVSLSYGYFSLWDFLRPGGRRQAVEWFQNVYADITALYPKAQISFIGHSNGTYLGTHALECENLDFRYMILAGSVVRRDFWGKKAKSWNWKSKVGRLLNIQAVDDWIVALFPGGLEVIPLIGKWMDLGGLGAFGDEYLDQVYEQRAIPGGHSAGIDDEKWDSLASFVLNEDPRLACIDGDKSEDSENNTSPPFVKPTELFRNKLLRIIRPIGALLILIAILLSFSLFILSGMLSFLQMVNHPLTAAVASHLPSMLIILLVISVISFSLLKNI
jgi:hypothetical protein